MKTIQVTYCFYPDPVGGTEVYVEALSQRLREQGVEVLIAAPAAANAAYLYRGIPVRRFRTPENITDLRDLYDEGDCEAAFEFGKILDEEKPDVVHIHAFTRAVSARTILEVKKRGICLIFTYHTPTVSCQCGLLLRWKNEICDGKVRLNLCTTCTLNRFGLPRFLATILCHTPAIVCFYIRKMHLRGKLFTALRMRGLIRFRRKALNILFREADYFVAVSRWVSNVLLINGVPQQKIVLSQHGILVDEKDDYVEDRESSWEGPLKIVYLGRIDWTKGLDIFTKALLSLPRVPIQLDIYGVLQSDASQRYFEKIKQSVVRDQRITFLPALSHEKITSILPQYHYLVVPSVWLETGPLVVLESFLARVPVIGSNLGGIAELVTHDVNGLLVQHNSLQEWQRVLVRVSSDRALAMRLRSGIVSPRSMREAAKDMQLLYERCFSAKGNAATTQPPSDL